jgi:hypothetical protein
LPYTYLYLKIMDGSWTTPALPSCLSVITRKQEEPSALSSHFIRIVNSA